MREETEGSKGISDESENRETSRMPRALRAAQDSEPGSGCKHS